MQDSTNIDVEEVYRAAATSLGGWLTFREAAPIAKVCPRTLANEARAGRLRAIRLGVRRGFRTKPEWVEQWAMSRELTSADGR